MLEHTKGKCTGNWRLVGSGKDPAVQCDECSARHDASPENRLEAIDENYAGIYLRRLTAEGIQQMSK